MKCDACRAACKFDAVKIVSGPDQIAAAVAAPALASSAAPSPLPSSLRAHVVRWVTK